CHKINLKKTVALLLTKNKPILCLGEAINTHEIIKRAKLLSRLLARSTMLRSFFRSTESAVADISLALRPKAKREPVLAGCSGQIRQIGLAGLATACSIKSPALRYAGLLQQLPPSTAIPLAPRPRALAAKHAVTHMRYHFEF